MKMNFIETGKKNSASSQAKGLVARRRLCVSSNAVAKIVCSLHRPSVGFVVDLVNFFDTTVDYIILEKKSKRKRL